MRHRYGGYRLPKPKKLTDKQLAAERAKYNACTHTVEGLGFHKGYEFADRGQLYRVETIGVRYHEDCPAMYGVRPIRGPKEWKATVEIRNAIDQILKIGTPEPLRADVPGEACPDGEILARWRDKRYQSLAVQNEIEIREGGIIRVTQPHYDDLPTQKWVRDAKLAKKLAELVREHPTPAVYPEHSVRAKQSNRTE